MEESFRTVTVCAVVLVHNNASHLDDIVHALKEQTYPVQAIVIVDNGSRPDVAERIEAFRDNDVQVLRLHRNVGVGAGHNAGWKYAMQKYDPTFIWALEHDAVPAETCLAVLIDEYYQFKESLSLAAVNPIQEQGLDYDQHSYYVITSRGPRQLQPRRNNYLGGISFNGLLLPVTTIKKYGVLREDFFVGQEDIEYNNRLWTDDKHILRSARAVIVHDLYKNRKPVHFGANVLLFPNGSIFRDYYSTRNAIVVKKEYGLNYWKTVLLSLTSLIVILLFRDQKLKRLTAKWCAVRDGMTGQLGEMSYSFLENRSAPQK